MAWADIKDKNGNTVGSIKYESESEAAAREAGIKSAEIQRVSSLLQQESNKLKEHIAKCEKIKNNRREIFKYLSDDERTHLREPESKLYDINREEDKSSILYDRYDVAKSVAIKITVISVIVFLFMGLLTKLSPGISTPVRVIAAVTACAAWLITIYFKSRYNSEVHSRIEKASPYEREISKLEYKALDLYNKDHPDNLTFHDIKKY